MQHGMQTVIDYLRVERELRDQALERHLLVNGARLRNPHPERLATLSSSLRALFASRPVLREERGV